MTAILPTHFRQLKCYILIQIWLKLVFMVQLTINIGSDNGLGRSGDKPLSEPMSFDVYFDLRPNKRLCLQTIVRLVIWDAIAPLWRHRNLQVPQRCSIICLHHHVTSSSQANPQSWAQAIYIPMTMCLKKEWQLKDICSIDVTTIIWR